MTIPTSLVSEEKKCCEGGALLFQEDGRSGHEGDASPVPDHNDEDAGRKKSLHGKPDLGETSILMNALELNRNTVKCLCCV